MQSSPSFLFPVLLHTSAALENWETTTSLQSCHILRLARCAQVCTIWRTLFLCNWFQCLLDTVQLMLKNGMHLHVYIFFSLWKLHRFNCGCCWFFKMPYTFGEGYVWYNLASGTGNDWALGILSQTTVLYCNSTRESYIASQWDYRLYCGETVPYSVAHVCGSENLSEAPQTEYFYIYGLVRCVQVCTIQWACLLCYQPLPITNKEPGRQLLHVVVAIRIWKKK
jgi:hypothetical protein